MIMRRSIRLLAFAAALIAAPSAFGQGMTLPAQNGLPAAPSIFGVGDVNSGLYFGTKRVGITNHLESGNIATSNVPVLSACGGAVAGDAGSTDTAGTVTQGGTVTTCTITFGSAYTAAPTCIVSDLTGTRASMATAITASAIAVTGITASDKLAWICIAKNGG